MKIEDSRWLTWILVISILLRVGAAVMLGNTVENLPGTADQISYHTLATRILEGHGFTFGQVWWPITRANEPTAHWSFLYTFYLVGVYGLFGVHPIAARLLQAVIVGFLQPLLTYLLAKRLIDRRAGIIAAGLNAIYAYFIYYAATLMTEPFYITAILGALLASIRLADAVRMKEKLRWSAVLGLCLGCAVLLRQLFLLFVPFLLLWVWWVNRKESIRKAVVPLMVSLAIVTAMILPFTAFNYTRFHRFVLLNTNAGYALFWGNHPIYGTKFIPILPSNVVSYAELIPEELRSLDEAALDQALMKRAVEIILADPGRYVLLSISRIPAYFMFWPSNDSGLISNLSRVGSFGVFWPFMLAGLIRALVGKYRLTQGGLRSPVALLALFGLVYTGIHVLTWALVRYRLPIDAVFLVFAAYAFCGIWDWWRARSTRKVVSG